MTIIGTYNFMASEIVRKFLYYFVAPERACVANDYFIFLQNLCNFFI